MTYAYLGPEGTFTQRALLDLRAHDHGAHQETHQESHPGADSRAYPTVAAAVDAVREGACTAAVIPVENSVRGVVPATLDQLVQAGLHITAETEVPVTFALMAPQGTALEDVTQVRSHPHALGQCDRWLAQRLPRARTAAADSTAAAARDLAVPGASGRAAIAAPVAAELYQLRILAEGIGEHPGAVTRFVSVRPPSAPPAPTGFDRTSLVVSVGASGSGVLVEILTVFSSRGINLTWIQSWPTGDRLGSYRFFLDVDGHIEDPAVRDAMSGLAALPVDARFLGSYPRATTPAMLPTAA